jgi:hypothetical protein
VTVDGDKIRGLLDLASGKSEPRADDGLSEQTEPTPPAGPPHAYRTLTIGMATSDDYHGASSSVQALRVYHADVMDRISILVLDHDPTGRAAWPLKELEAQVEQLRYVPCDDVRGTAVRDLLFRYATSDWVLVIDDGMLFEPGSLDALLRYIEEDPDSDDLLHGPIESNEFAGKVAGHVDPTGRSEGPGGEGTGALAPSGVPLRDLGCFAARRKSWLGLNPRFTGFGGEEAYLHEKYRQHGRRTRCLPFLRWARRFPEPAGTQYPNQRTDRLRNALIGWDELGLDTTEMIEQFRAPVGDGGTDRVATTFQRDRSSPFWVFDAIYCINLDSNNARWAEMQRRFEHLGIADRVRRFPAVKTPESHHIGCALSHRRIIEEARHQALDNVLVFEDDAIFLEGTTWCLRRSLADLGDRDWDLLYLGGCRWGAPVALAPGCEYLEIAGALTCSHALAYRHTVFEQILGDLPDTVDEMEGWCAQHLAIDQYLMNTLSDRERFLTVPPVATQAQIRSFEKNVYRDAFTI